jgi:4-amino-4-deoxy-L-arabinose transferase-like glycosyltransferase
MRLLPFLLAALCAVVLFSGLRRVGYLDVGEARDAEVARELIRNHEPLTPLLARQPVFEKPVLGYAPEVLAQLVSHHPGRLSRIIRALGALMLVILAASVGAEHFGGRAGWCSGLVLITTLLVPVVARTDETQLLGTFLAWVGCAGFADAIFGRRAGRGLRLIVAWGALAAALVCAGPLPAIWPVLGVLLYAGLARDRDALRAVGVIPGLVLMIGVALPWYTAMTERHGAAFLAHVPWFPYAGDRLPSGSWWLRLASIVAGPAYALSFLVMGCFPWSMILPVAIQHAGVRWLPARRRTTPVPSANQDPPRSDPLVRERREESVAHFFIACMFAGLAPLASTPLPPLAGALPALPAAALLCGRLLDHLFENPSRVSRYVTRAAIMLALFGTTAGITLAYGASRLRDLAPELRLLGSVVFATSWPPLLACLARRHRLAAVLFVLPIAIGTPAMTMRLLPAMEGYLNTRAAGEAMNLASPVMAPLVVLESPPPSLRIYTHHNLVIADSLARDLERNRAADGLAYIAFRPSRESEVARQAPGPLEIIARTPSLVVARVHPAQ